MEVDASDVISGIMRHGKFVQMPENKMFQVENPRSFSVLCFTDSVNVPEVRTINKFGDPNGTNKQMSRKFVCGVTSQTPDQVVIGYFKKVTVAHAQNHVQIVTFFIKWKVNLFLKYHS